MSKKNIFLGALLLLMLLECFSIYLFASSPYETEKVKNSYRLIEEKLKLATSDFCDTTIIITIDKMPVEFVYNKNGQISHLGLVINPATISNGCDEAFQFIKDCLFSLAFMKSETGLEQFIDDNNLLIIINNAPIKHDLSKIQLIVKKAIDSYMSVSNNNTGFLATGDLLTGEKYAILFPSNINLIMGMDKIELEENFMLKLSTNFPPIPARSSFLFVKPYGKDLFIESGEHLIAGNFGSDVYLAKKETTYFPVFSKEHIVESLSNIFTCNMCRHYEVDLSYMLYGNKKVQEKISLEHLHSCLANECIVYFGLQSNQNNVLKATVIYYHPIYHYCHMLLIEIDHPSLFIDNAVMKGLLYTYIPYN